MKGNAGGHGAIMISKHLKSIGVERLVVATIQEGKELRTAGITGPIHVLGRQLLLTSLMVFMNTTSDSLLNLIMDLIILRLWFSTVLQTPVNLWLVHSATLLKKQVSLIKSKHTAKQVDLTSFRSERYTRNVFFSKKRHVYTYLAVMPPCWCRRFMYKAWSMVFKFETAHLVTKRF